MSAKTVTFTEGLREAFDALRARRSDSEPSWWLSGRERALDVFMEAGLPTTDQEEWRFTNVAPLGKLSPRIPEARTPSSTEHGFPRLGSWKRHELVFVDGRYSETLSSVARLPAGVWTSGLERALRERPELVESWLRATSKGSVGDDLPFSVLNRAFLEDGAVIEVPTGMVVEEPIHLVFLSSGKGAGAVMATPRNLVMAREGSQVRILETYSGPESATYFTNAVTEIRAEERALVDHYKLQQESRAAFHFGALLISEARDASVTSHSISIGARLARNDIQAHLSGMGSEVTLNGLYVVTGNQLVDHHTVIYHEEPRCMSRELYKGILDEASRGVFNGKVIVRPDAQKTDASQTNKNLLLSEDALVNTNPQLEIHADDVKCAHGATIGQLDAEALFYLRSRGIGREDARKILTQGFAAEVSQRIEIAVVKDAVDAIIARAA
jgi:Fe-S cluster assembly protein SufD